MNTLTLPIDVAGELRARAEIVDHQIVLSLSGTADLRVAEEMGTILRAVHQQALERKAQCVVVDLRELEFMNSSCFKAFVSWIADLQELPSDKQYRVKFLSCAAMLWQRRSLHALSCFAQHLVSVERIERA